jgi:DNA-binding transcriptional LysR family regulator
MLDRLTGMQVFSKVAALGSFSAAGRALGISPSMATKHIDAIEDRLGAQLFFRSTRKLTLSDAGARYLDACERIIAEIEEADAAAAADVVEPRGRLKLSAPLSFGFRQVMPALADFARNYPALAVDVGLTDRLIDLVEEGWDLAIRIGALRDSNLVARRLAPIRVVLCASPDYLAAHGTPKTIADLAAHNCLGYTLPTPATAGRWTFGADGSVVAMVSGNLTANNGDALRVAALAGQGLIYQPTFLLADDLRTGRLVPVHLDHPGFQFASVHAVFAASHRMPAKVRALIDFLANRWRDAPWDDGMPPIDAGPGR